MEADIIIIGSGVGGGSVALSLAPTGAKILIIERGPKLEVKAQTIDAETVFVKRQFHAKEQWQHQSGKSFSPGQFYYVGGHTKFYGTAMFRFREQDFKETKQEDGISPAWPISYQDLEPYYAEAERLFGVRGQAGIDPTEPWRSGAFPHPPIPHEPLMARLSDGLKDMGLRPFPMPAAVDFGVNGRCVRCNQCDAFPCRYAAKGDAETALINRALAYPNVTLWSESRVTRLLTDESGINITAALVDRAGESVTVHAPRFVLSAGAIPSALLLLRSANAQHPNGLANRSGCVGKYLMIHHLSGLMGLMPGTVNDTRFTKTLSINDFYFGSKDDPRSSGNIQMLGNIQGPMIHAAVPSLPRWAGNWFARHSVDWLVMSEDLPDAASTVRPLDNDRAEVHWEPKNREPHLRLVQRGKKLLRRLGFWHVVHHPFGIESPSHQCGTVRMGNDPATSALNRWCRAHDHPNLYVVDASFFPSSAALNPALTVAAQALRVGAHLKETLTREKTR